MWYRWFYRAPLFLILGGALIILIGYVVMLLWNALIPALFHGPVLTFWQAIGLLVLVKILFHSHRYNRWHSNGWHPSYHRHWKKRFEEKIAAMNPEDREKFKEEWRKRCRPGYWHHSYYHHFDEQAEQDKKE
jgi:hypothetical protein